jgi:DNA polymerase-3 subunit alpha
MFVHLRLHTEFSVVDGTNRIDDTVKGRAAADGQPALAITDLNNLFGAIKFYKAARGAGVKPLIGAEIVLEGLGAGPWRSPRMVLLVQNQQGYLNLCELLARAWTQNVVVRRVVPPGLAAGTGRGPDRLVGRAGRCRSARPGAGRRGTREPGGAAAGVDVSAPLLPGAAARRPPGRRAPCQRRGAAGRAAASAGGGHPSGAVHAPDDYEAHEARVCIADGEILGNRAGCASSRASSISSRHAQMQQLFADMPSALANTVEIARALQPDAGAGQAAPAGFPDAQWRRCHPRLSATCRTKGLQERLAHLYPDAAVREAAAAALCGAARIRDGHHPEDGFPGLLPDRGRLHQLGQEQRLPGRAGPGFGCRLAGGLCAGITDLDPLQYNLLFERFLNPERVSMPDFDIDFCQATATASSTTSSQVRQGRGQPDRHLRHHGRARRHPRRRPRAGHELHLLRRHQQADPEQAGQHITIDGAIKAEPILAERLEKEEDVKTLLALAQKLEGMTRNVGMHAGGVLIAPGKLTDFCPLYQQPGSDSAVSQYDKDDVEAPAWSSSTFWAWPR